MLYRRSVLLSLVLLFSWFLHAQTLTPGVLASAGGSGSSGGVQLDWVLGQSSVITGSDDQAFLTQGFLQPELQVWTGTVDMPAWGGCQLSIPYTVSGVIDPANIFTAELSDAQGNFFSPVVLGRAIGNINGVINGVVPANVLAGAGYRIRVRSSLPFFVGMANEKDLTIRMPFIPDALAYPVGVQPNTIYVGWAPAASLTLTADAKGAVDPTYMWQDSSGLQVGTGAQLVVTQAGTYTVTVSANGCTATATKTVRKIDVSCGTLQAPRVAICQQVAGKPETSCVLPSSVAFQLQTGAQLGFCGSLSGPDTLVVRPTPPTIPVLGRFDMFVYPNPTSTYFRAQLQSDNVREKISVRVFDMSGKMVEEFTSLSAQQVISFGQKYAGGMYIAQMIQGPLKKQFKLIKQNK